MIAAFRNLARAIIVLSGLFYFLPENALAQKRVALVVGNSNYQLISALNNPRNDAKLMAATLEKVGFEVIVATNVDIRAMAQAMRRFGKALRAAGKDAVGLFYYAGHGVQSRGENYLIPLNARVETEEDLSLEAISATQMLGQMESAGNALNLVILDACRNNPFKSGFRSATRGFSRIRAPSGSLIAFSAAPGQVASDGTGENSPYTTALVSALQKPGLSIEQVFKRVRVRVEDQTGSSQTPWEESSLRGEFYFVEKAKTAPASPVTSTSPIEISYWESVKNSTDADDLRSYLKLFPRGIFADLAMRRISRIEKTAKLDTQKNLNTTHLKPRARAYRPSVDIAKIVSPAIVKVSLIDANWRKKSDFENFFESTNGPTGFFVSSEGHFVTSHSLLVRKANKVTVKIDDKTITAELVGTYSPADLALLKISGDQPFPHLKFASRIPTIGEDVLIFGNYQLIPGQILGLESASANRKRLQLNVVLGRTHAGGAIIDAQGKVIGIGRSNNDSEGKKERNGYGLPANVASEIVSQLLEQGRVFDETKIADEYGKSDILVDPIYQQMFKDLDLVNIGSAGKTVVTIETDGEYESGYGILVSERGHILTSFNLVESANNYRVKTENSSSYSANIVGRDPKTGIAVLKLATPKNDFQFIELSEKPPQLGHQVFAYLGTDSFGSGIMSSPQMYSLTPHLDKKYFERKKDLGISLFDETGAFVGLIVNFLPQSKEMNLIRGWLSGVSAKNDVQQLIEFGETKRGWLGVQIQTMTELLTHGFGMSKIEGAIVAEVVTGSPAELAGMQSGDVILAVDEHKVIKMRVLPGLVAKLPPGKSAVFKVLRNRQHINLVVTMGELKELASNESAQINQKSKSHGVVIAKIDSKSIFGKNEVFAKGNLLLKLNNTSIRTPADYWKIIKKTKKNKQIAINFLIQTKNGDKVFVGLPLDQIELHQLTLSAIN